MAHSFWVSMFLCWTFFFCIARPTERRGTEFQRREAPQERRITDFEFSPMTTDRTSTNTGTLDTESKNIDEHLSSTANRELHKLPSTSVIEEPSFEE